MCEVGIFSDKLIMIFLKFKNMMSNKRLVIILFFIFFKNSKLGFYGIYV